MSAAMAGHKACVKLLLSVNALALVHSVQQDSMVRYLLQTQRCYMNSIWIMWLHVSTHTCKAQLFGFHIDVCSMLVVR